MKEAIVAYTVNTVFGATLKLKQLEQSKENWTNVSVFAFLELATKIW